MIQKKSLRFKLPARWMALALLPVLLAGSGTVNAQQDKSAAGDPYGKIVREIKIAGLRLTGESIVRNQLASQAGKAYTRETEKLDYRWLDRLGVFASIRTAACVIENEVVLTIEVREFPPVIPYPTLNITDENGASGGLGTRATNLMGRAVALSGSSKFGGLTEIHTGLHAPWLLRRREWYSVRYDYRDRVNKDDAYRENSHELELRVGLSLHPDWMLSGRFGFLSMGSDTAGITLSPDSRDTTPYLGLVLEYDGRDSFSNPHQGWQGIFDIAQNGGFLGGDGDFATAQIDIRRYQPITSRQFLALFLYGTIQSSVVGRDVPVYRDYQIGGTNSVRGWDSGARRGNNQFLSTLEFRYELVPPKTFRVYRYELYAGLQLAAFADLGTAWSGGSGFTRNVIAGGGFGFRFLVPFVKMVRLDFGFGQSGSGINPHLHLREKADYSSRRIR
ncbi:MAG: BamA/TamA family outer membrane protein [Acidobacteria bacterium]|nr:BamA/TamA family outer membrane protein [Acidobacteriota bacterium]